MGKFFSRWLKNGEGATAIEFSLLAIPYFMITIGIIEMSIMFTAAALLEGATSKAARLLRTGQIQQASADAGEQEELFRQALCAETRALLQCGGIVIEALNMGDYGSYDSFAPQFDENGNMSSQGFDPGDSNDVVLLRVAYRYTMMTPIIGNLLGENGTNTRQFFSTVVLQTEPYNPADAGV